MERKRIEKLVVLLLVGILIPVSLFPFRIDADTITSSNIHLNTSLISVNYDHTPNFYNYKYEFVFDKEYVGWISVQVVSTYYSDNNFTQSQYTFTKAIYVNGATASITNGFYSSGNYSGGCLVSASFSLVNSNVTEYSVINSLDQITDILNDVSNYVSIDVLFELQNIVSNTSLANDYLEDIANLRQWHIPIESFQAVLYCMRLYNTYEVKQLNYFDYPMFNLSVGNSIANFFYNKNYSYILIFGTNYNFSYNASGLADMFDTTQEISSYQIQELYSMNGGIKIVKCILNFPNNGNVNIKLNHDSWYIPIYSALNLYKYFSLEFALRYGLSNQLLDDLHIIAQGTNQSSSASGSLDQTTSQFSNDANDLVTIEESFNNSMNQSLQNVNPTFNMGSSFLTSANWVSQQFNRIVNNTPFASLITFGLTLGLGLLIIGKVRK